MTPPGTLYEQALPIALGLARDRYLPGHDRDDVRQEARIALWTAARTYRRELGTWPAFARLVVRRRLDSLTRTANNRRNGLLTNAARDDELERQAADAELELRLDVAELLHAIDTLTMLERRAILGIAAGYSYEELAGAGGTAKQIDNAATRARRRLRERIAA